VVIAANVVTALQSIVARRVDPVEPVVVTVGTIEGGRRFNILAESVRLTGTVRTLSREWRDKVPKFLEQIVAGVVKSQGGRYKLAYERLSPAVVNPPEMADLALDVARTTLGAKRALRIDRPSMGGEDFSEFLGRAPGCYFYLGTGADEKTRRPWHHPSFFLHEESMVAGVKFLTALGRQALRYLS